ncbi:MAG: hypothetical protein JRG73_11765 [Deltaproteobacteria bacterium]|nr:hypothetical protein [Deltaproteobacteria bacterium]MBW2307598.1 hypothetical protein [Deltaproteobacteria bacterium]
MDRIKKTFVQGSLGYLGGILVDHGLEALTGVDFVNGMFEIAGAVLGVANANRDLIQQLHDTIVRSFGKEPVELTEEEWKSYKQRYPHAAAYLERALQI